MTQPVPKVKNPLQGNLPLIFMLAGALLLFFLLFILPTTQKFKAQTVQMTRVRAEIERQKTLRPLRDHLAQATELPLPAAIPDQETDRLELRQVGRFSAHFDRAARSHDVEFGGVLPNINTLSENRRQLQLNLEATGNFENLHRFMVEVFHMPYTDRVQYLELARTGAKDSLTMRLWVHVK
jgi:hypothetical protein